MSVVAESCPLCIVEPRSIEAIVHSEFRSSAYAPLRDVGLQFDEDALTLIGCVPSFYLKQLAVALSRRKLNGIRIVDRLDVVSF